jgi:dihydrolipoamide dehydrogenase
MEPMRRASCAGLPKRLNNHSCCRFKVNFKDSKKFMADNTNLQLAVVGGGPGGYAAAFLAADLGLKVTLIDPEVNPGGVCLYRGCIPSKALLHVSKLIEESHQAKNWGIEFSDPKIDLAKLRAWKESVVKRLTGGLGQLSKQRSVKYIQGRAGFENANTLRVTKADGSGESLRFDRILLATGSRPAVIPTLKIESPRMMDSTGALDLKDIPKTLLVVGGGYIGLELGSVYAALGTKVTVVEMLSGLLPGADRDLVLPLHKRLEKAFDGILLNTTVKSLKEESGGIRATFDGADVKEREKVFEKVLVSVGRKPNSEIPGLDKTRVNVGPKGFIQVNKQLQTDDPSIYAIGDVVGEPMLAHKAMHEGRTAVEAIIGRKVAFEPHAIPAVVFTDPEIAWAGLTETQAKENGREIAVAKFPWGASGRAITLDRPDGMTKLILDPKTERVLGVGIVGVGAGDLISEGVLAIEMAALAGDLELTIHPHPTLSETVMEAAEVFFGTSTDVYRPKRG